MMLDQNLSLLTTLLGMLVIPISAGTIVSMLLLRRSLGRVTLQRALVKDRAARPIWRLVATCHGRPAKNCRITAGGNDLLWEGVGTIELDIGQGGVGVAYIPFELSADAIITVKSGSYTILRKSFRSLEEAYTSTNLGNISNRGKG